MLVAGSVVMVSCNQSTDSAKAEEAAKSEAKCGQGKCGGDCGDSDEKEAKVTDYFAAMDANSDGTISLDEFKSHAEADYKAKDKNESGDVCSNECMMFDKFNTDGDDKLSLEEFVAGHEAMFAKIDADANQGIDKAEWDSFAASMHQEHGDAKCGK